jgi:hypothetical protein
MTIAEDMKAQEENVQRLRELIAKREDERRREVETQAYRGFSAKDKENLTTQYTQDIRALSAGLEILKGANQMLFADLEAKRYREENERLREDARRMIAAAEESAKAGTDQASAGRDSVRVQWVAIVVAIFAAVMALVALVKSH